MTRRANFMCDTRREQVIEALFGAFATAGNAGGIRIVVKWRLDIKADPIDLWQQSAQAIGVDACGMQADLEAAMTDVIDRRTEVTVNRGLASAENHAIQQPLSTIQKFEDRLP